jgi:ABC-type multidrug transport system ATPase subunit
MICARDLRKRYGSTCVLDGISFHVAPGERIAVLGVNGAGKTTLLRCLLGLTDFEGALEVDGEPAGPAAVGVRRRLGYVPQLPPVFDLTLAGFLELVADVREIPRERAAARLEDLGLPLAAEGDKPLRDLSGGMLQKAYLALALAAEAPVLLLDEPTASLDPGSRREFVRLLSRVKPDTTVVLASHRLEEIEPLTDRLVVLHRGRIVFDGSLPELWEATGMRARLWLRTGAESRCRVARALADLPFVRSAHANGAGIHVEADAESYLPVLLELRNRGLPVAEFSTHPPALEEVLEKLVEAADSPARRAR